jgi:chaperonin cofactor prefoldin
VSAEELSGVQNELHGACVCERACLCVCAMRACVRERERTSNHSTAPPRPHAETTEALEELRVEAARLHTSKKKADVRIAGLQAQVASMSEAAGAVGAAAGGGAGAVGVAASVSSGGGAAAARSSGGGSSSDAEVEGLRQQVTDLRSVLAAMGAPAGQGGKDHAHAVALIRAASDINAKMFSVQAEMKMMSRTASASPHTTAAASPREDDTLEGVSGGGAASAAGTAGEQHSSGEEGEEDADLQAQFEELQALYCSLAEQFKEVEGQLKEVLVAGAVAPVALAVASC